ncbi:tol-pal system protein YbgF [Massilia forsythiae]|uniref:Cell division coordinator CpoB n=1 Tax=Massilia forsythiae TaxID=2728020 RepID=A0A7Z2VSK8_9BURK|nr:tol-pal system protein YbgF [Massilia forsythiae]QJD98687.1 tol-pal system protein YbgF [Massilia forsythiae]
MINLPKPRLAAVALALAAWLPLHAGAGILDDDEARRAILDLRTKVDALSRDVNGRIDNKADKSISVDILNQHEQTMQEIARLRGQLEVLSNQVASAQKGQKDLYADLDARIKKLEPRQETIDGQTAEVLPSEKKSYEGAMELFKSGDYKGAAASLQDFVRRFPDSAYASNAQYWLGNAFYAQRDYKNAIAAQESVVANYGTSAKAPDAMLNIASSYTELKDKKNAKKALQQLVTKFPDSTAAQAAKDRLAALK